MASHKLIHAGLTDEDLMIIHGSGVSKTRAAMVHMDWQERVFKPVETALRRAEMEALAAKLRELS